MKEATALYGIMRKRVVDKLSIKDLDSKNRKVLMRVDFNVPTDGKGKITDDTRIAASLPSIKYLLSQGASIVLMSHMGRPKGKRVPELSLAPCAKRLSELLHIPVQMASDCIGEEVRKKASQLKPCEVLLLENLRFHSGEEHPEEEPTFAKQLAGLGELYVNDAFSNAHRAHSSTTGVVSFFPDKAAAGFHLQQEIAFLGQALLHPKHPFHAIVGGAKTSSKLGVIHALVKQADALLIGGGMAFTFLKAQGFKIGASLCEEDLLDSARELIDQCKSRNIPLLLPEDVVIAAKLDNNSKKKVVTLEEGIPDGWYGVDIGPATIKNYTNQLQGAATVFWNGPLGIFEMPNFATGTYEIAKALAELKEKKGAITIIGGGDSLSAIKQLKLENRFSHLSTGGGASLEYIEHGSLPGVEALSDRRGKNVANK
jgi:phosphoglycerate kinase